MKIIKKRGQNLVTFITNELSFERKIENLEKVISDEIRKKSKKKGKKLIGVIGTYRWGSKEAHYDTNKKLKTSKAFSKAYETEEEANKIYKPGDIKTLSGNKRYKGENFTWKKEFNPKAKKWIVSAYHHLQHGESYYNGYKIPANAPLTVDNIRKTFIADLEEKYDIYAYQKQYDKPYKLRSVTLNFIYE